ncbi:protein of unknown function [Micropruina glycogenica]|uniref:Uncharacterized protein n=1 Tax=Micropruina glycogenica TaxID=75385 RepID=A0A2N9JLC3_9ACTN|nr:protein of unknown function [Micropruina glycogenica]
MPKPERRDGLSPARVTTATQSAYNETGPCPIPPGRDLLLCGGPSKIRTCDTRFRKPLLYPLSYGAGRPGQAQHRGRAGGLAHRPLCRRGHDDGPTIEAVEPSPMVEKSSILKKVTNQTCILLMHRLSSYTESDASSLMSPGGG